MCTYAGGDYVQYVPHLAFDEAEEEDGDDEDEEEDWGVSE